MKREFTIHQLRVFLKVAELGSITRAANTLSTPQPSISRSIASIEKALKVKLIERHQGGTMMTPAGQNFHIHAREAIRHFDLASLAATRAQTELSGEVRLAATDSFAGVIFRPLVKRFQENYPGAHIQVMTSASIHIPSLIDNNVVDMGIIADTHSAPAMPSEKLCQEFFYLIGAKTSAIDGRETITLKEVSDLPLFLNAMRGGFRSRLNEAFYRNGLEMKVLAEIDANEPILDLVFEEEGYTILPYSAIARRSRIDQLCAARIVSPAISRMLRLVVTPSYPVSAICRQTTGLVRRLVYENAELAKWKTIPVERAGLVNG